MTPIPPKESFSGANVLELARRVRGTLPFASVVPAHLFVDDRERTPSMNWLERWAPACRRDVFAAWDEAYEKSFSYSRDTVVLAASPSAVADVHTVLARLDALPFAVASFGRVYPEWSDRDEYPIAGFGDLHVPLGWGCAFRAEGHERLVSRRWLEFGPWRLLRGQNDTSLIQFHDLGADPDTAFEQARAGHRRMGVSDNGGFIQTGYVYTHRIDGLYVAEERRLRILVHGREVTELEMLDACAARHYQILGSNRPLNSVAYVFADEAQARHHLHELWLRELECRTIIAGREVRLDSDYQPEPNKPAWVKALESNERRK